MKRPETDKVEILDLAKQLQCPQGMAGSDLGHLMYDSNKGMIIDSIASLRIKARNRILEIGQGNASHLELILKQGTRLRYFGLEISQTMIDEAQELNAKSIMERKAIFQLYDGLKIPYVCHFFDRVISVNTIYFWEDPKGFLAEIYRVLKPKGICIVTFADAEFMRKLPFVNDGFQLYDVEKMKELVGQTYFELVYFQKKKERVKSKNGKMVDRDFTIVLLKKEPDLTEES